MLGVVGDTGSTCRRYFAIDRVRVSRLGLADSHGDPPVRVAPATTRHELRARCNHGSSLLICPVDEVLQLLAPHLTYSDLRQHRMCTLLCEMQSIVCGTDLEGRWLLRDSACTSTELRRTDAVLFAVCGREHNDVKVHRAGLVYGEALGIDDALDIVVCLECHW